MAVALVCATAMSVHFASTTDSHGGAGLAAHISKRAHLTELDEENPCDALPYIRLMKVKSNNLGGHGPDTDKPEGLVYGARAFKTGLDNTTELEVHIHATNASAFSHDSSEGDEITDDYQPEWPSANGIEGHFAVVNVRPGTNVTLRIHAHNPDTKEDIELPRAAMTFFDLDTGKGGNHSVEYIKMNNYKAYFLTNTTEVKVSHDPDGSSTFTASKEGNGDDNPQNPLELTVLQKNRVVSFEFENEKEAVFQLGASVGKTARVFFFVMRPALRCAFTMLDQGGGRVVLPPNANNAPFTIVRGAGVQVRPSMALMIGLALALYRLL